MALTPTESQLLAILTSKVTSLEAINNDLLALIRSVGPGGVVDIAAHNNSLDAHAALFGTKIRNRVAANTNMYLDPINGNDSNSGIGAANTVKTWDTLMERMHRLDGQSRKTVNLFLAPGDYDGDLEFYCNPLFSGTHIRCATRGGQVNINGTLRINGPNPVYLYDGSFNIRAGSYAALAVAGAAVTIGNWWPTTFKTEGAAAHGIILTQDAQLVFGSVATWDADGLAPANSVFTIWSSIVEFHAAVNIIGEATGRKYHLFSGSTLVTGGRGPAGMPGTTAGVVDATSRIA